MLELDFIRRPKIANSKGDKGVDEIALCRSHFTDPLVFDRQILLSATIAGIKFRQGLFNGETNSIGRKRVCNLPLDHLCIAAKVVSERKRALIVGVVGIPRNKFSKALLSLLGSG